MVADLIDIARGERGPAFAQTTATLASLQPAGAEARAGRFYLRLEVEDRPGVLAELTAILRDADVSIESLVQPAPPPGAPALVAMLTHEASEAAVRAAAAAMAGLAATRGRPLVMPILPVHA
ncbi:MAG: ACT domain-containing protein [Sphingomonadaceae bacterium]